MAKRHHAEGGQVRVLSRIEEVVLAASGADAFELVFALVAARLAERAGRAPRTSPRTRESVQEAIAAAARAWPGLDPQPALDVPDPVLAEVEALLDRADLEGDAEALDAAFEQLVARVAKGEKGQFFTPRHVTAAVTRALLLREGERVVDPACGSGAFLVHARAQANVETWGYDVDARALRVARLLAVASGGDASRFVRGDSLRRDVDAGTTADVIVTNPPFAGAVTYDGYALAAASGRTVERDALFVERCLEILRPGGRMAIVLPHNKVASGAWAGLRRWLVERARVFAVVSLPRETFMPFTSQKCAVLFAKKRARPGADAREPVFLAVSEKAGKDAAGEPIVRPGLDPATPTHRALDHDLDALTEPLVAFLGAEGFAS